MSAEPVLNPSDAALMASLADAAARLCSIGYGVWDLGPDTVAVDERAGKLLGVAETPDAPTCLLDRTATPAGQDFVRAMETFRRSGQARGEARITVERDPGVKCFVRLEMRAESEHRIVAALEDETEQRRLEAEHRATLATVPSAMLVIDGNGAIRSVSATAERMFGRNAAELAGQPVSLLLPDLEALSGPGMVRYLAAGASRRAIQSKPLRAVRADRTDFPAEIWIGDASSEWDPLFTVFVRDHTNRIEMEAKLQQLQNDLIHASRLSAMGELSLALAHELNQPLATLVNQLGLIEHYAGEIATPGGKAIGATVGRAIEQAMRAGEIVKRLRAFVERREADMTIEQIDRIIGEAVSLLSSVAQRRGIALSLRLPGRGATVLADRVQLQQVVVNLMRNAMEALDQAGMSEKQLWISAQVRGGEIEVAVEDNGPGVAPDREAELFAPFSTTKERGMGVGLSISKRIVEAHGGMLRQQRGEAGGARFSFVLPLFRESLADA